MIVEFKRNGRRKNMNPKVARVLAAKGHVRIIDEQEACRPAEPVSGAIPDEQTKDDDSQAAQVMPPEPAATADGLDEMNREQLLKFAEDLEIKIHGRTGDERIREIIREHAK